MQQRLKLASVIAAVLTTSGLASHDANAGNIFKKFEREVLRPVGNAVEAAGRGVGRALEEVGEAALVAIEEIGEGDLIGAVYEGQKELINGVSDSTAKTMSESSVLRGATALAVGAIHPGAAAAFQAWYVREMTGSDSLALKTFTVSWATSAALGGIADLPPDVASAYEKALASAMVNGVATGMMGGDYEDGALMGALFSLADSYYRATTGIEPSAETASKDPLLKPSNADGRPLYSTDYVIVNRDHAQVGMGFGGLPENPSMWDYIQRDLLSEHSPVMEAIAKYVPGVQGGAILHDVQFHAAPTWAVVSTVPPWLVIHYYAVGGKQQEELLETVLRHAAQSAPSTRRVNRYASAAEPDQGA